MIESRTAQRNILVSVILAATLLLGCGRGGTSPPPSPAVSPTPLVATNPLLPTPQIAQFEEPLQGAPKYPDVFLLPSPQKKSDVASFLKTSVLQLDRANPGLPDPIPSGTLVAIPYDYLVTEPKLFASVAAETGLPQEMLFAYNPDLRNTENLPQGTRLLMPRLLIVSDETQFSAAAERLAVSQATLMQANPNLTGTEKLLPGTVLILPPEDKR